MQNKKDSRISLVVSQSEVWKFSTEFHKKFGPIVLWCTTRVPPPGSQTFLHPLGKNSFFFVNESLIHLIRILLHLLVRARPERYLDSEIKCHKAIPTSWTSIGIFFVCPASGQLRTKKTSSIVERAIQLMSFINLDSSIHQGERNGTKKVLHVKHVPVWTKFRSLIFIASDPSK